MSAYSLDVRIIQKKDQLEELSAIGAAISAPVVEEVRTGQQFLIKLHLSRNGVGHASRLPSLRVSRRVAINTAGESRTDPEPLTLEIAVHLAKSGQVRKGACAKCCHKVHSLTCIPLCLYVCPSKGGLWVPFSAVLTNAFYRCSVRTFVSDPFTSGSLFTLSIRPRNICPCRHHHRVHHNARQGRLFIHGSWRAR